MTGDVQVPDGGRGVDLSTQIATDHWITTFQGIHCVGCGWWEPLHMEDNAHAMRRHVAEVTIAALASVTGEVAEKAWDEGYDAGCEDMYDNGANVPPYNPYRATRIARTTTKEGDHG